MKLRRRFLIVFTTLFILTFVCQIAYGNDYIKTNNNVYMVIVNKLTLLDIENMPKLNQIIDEGNIGLMNVRGLNGYKGGESFITINASARAYANNESSSFYNLNKEYKSIYENKVGYIEDRYAIGNIHIGKLYNQNENNNYSPYLGALGDSLHEAGLKTAIFGNSDTDEENIRTAALIPMDSKGLIDYGNLDNILVESKASPYGIKTDYEKILNELTHIKSKASLIVIDTGDLNRLNNYSHFLSIDTFNHKRELILKDIDEFIGSLTNSIDKENSLLLILSPNGGEERIDGNKLSPIILWGKGVEKGTITSSTTNKKGIISNLDISPTIANFLNTSTEKMLGSSVVFIKEDNGINYINNINNRINTTSKLRSKTLLIYGIISIVFLLIIISLFLMRIRIDNKIAELLRIWLILLYGLPLIFILNSIFNLDNQLKYILNLVVFIGSFVFLLKKYNGEKTMYLLIFSYFIIMIIDTLFNGIITRFSILSHDPIIGARYFGLGNELVGVILANTAIITGLSLRKYKNKFISILIMILSIFIVGHPKLGANVGGTIALLFATFYFILETKGKQLNFKNIVFTVVLISFIIMALGYIDIVFSPNPTHLGKTLILLKNEGFSIIQKIINRKLLMNIKLVGTSIWTKVLLANIFSQIIISYLYKDTIEKLINDSLGKGILSGIIGSIAGFLLNDSGIILSAISMNLITFIMLFFIIYDEEIFFK